jgi:uncharacterized protein YukE
LWIFLKGCVEVTQLRAEFGTIDQLAADQGGHAGDIEGFRAQLKAEVSKALDNFAGGLGENEHHVCMQKADQLIDQYVQNMQRFQGTTNQVNDTFQQGGRRAQSTLASGA